jgi:hypothetical protein
MKKPNLNIDVTAPETMKEAMSVNEKTGGATGKHIVTIKQASVTYTNSGAAKLQLAFESENEKIWKLNEQFITAGEEKDFAPTYFKPILSSILILTNSSGNIGQTKIDVTKFVDGQPVQEEEIVDSYNDLIGKKIGVVMKYYQKYPDSLAINGYTNRPIPERMSDPQGYEAAKKLPTTIWMPNYGKDTRPVFDVVLYFDPQTEKTLSELQDDECIEPTMVRAAVDKLKNHDPEAIKWDNKKWDTERTKRLKRNLSYHGEAYNHSKFIPSEEAPDDETEEVIYDVE